MAGKRGVQNVREHIRFGTDDEHDDRHVGQRGNQRKAFAERLMDVEADTADVGQKSVEFGKSGSGERAEQPGDCNDNPRRIADEEAGGLNDDEKGRGRKGQPRAGRNDGSQSRESG